MLDIQDLIDYAQDDCVFDIYNIDCGAVIKQGLSASEIRKWHDNHSYELISFEPLQRQDRDGVGNWRVVFGIQFNIHNEEAL